MYAVNKYGQMVSGLDTHCTRCGCPIKHVYEFDGKPYGSTCIEAVSGVHPDNWVFTNGRGDFAATKLSVAEKEAKRLAAQQKEAERIAKVEAIRKANAERYAGLVNVLRNVSKYNGDFCDSMADSILADGWSTELDQILRGRAYSIVRDIWAKAHGRKNSAGYTEALACFDAM